ncbi:MAG TPA: GNA1162 family protein [Thermoanaerobaculia bacterium]|nr:GNA1162 family protein [Thermoanaerobaculia bacterium]
MEQRIRRTGTAAAIALLLFCAACAHSVTQFVHPNADLAALKSVAVLPFENLSADRTAGDKVQKIFSSELLSTGAFNVVEPGLVSKTLKASRIETVESLGPGDFKKLGEELKADAVFMGTVVDFAESRSGQTPTPDITIQLRLVECQSGATVWSASRSKSGASASARLFGIGGQSLTEAARQVVRQELGTLVK